MAKFLYTKGLRCGFSDVNSATNVVSDSLRRKHNFLNVIVDGNCRNVVNILNKNLDKKYFYETYHWLVISDDIPAYLDSLKLNINSDVTLAVKNDKYYTIKDVYNPASEHGGEVRISTIGHYNTTDYNIREAPIKYWARRDMTGVKFKSAVVIPQLDKPLREYLDDESDRQINSMHRFQSVCVNHCRDLFNFSLDIQRTTSWGYIQPNGRFDGLVSLLEKRLVDFGSSPLLFKLDRLPFVDYSYGNWILRSTFIYRRPERSSSRSSLIFLRPFALCVWFSVVITLFIITFLLKIAWSIQKGIVPPRKIFESSWSFIILFVIGSFCQQGIHFGSFLLSSRILTIFTVLFCLLIYQFYSASIVSYILMDPPRTIFNLRDLLESDLSAGVEDILIDRNYFVQTTDPDAINLYERKIKLGNNNSGYYAPVEGLEKVRRGGFAFHVETSTAYPLIEAAFSNSEICELEEVQMYRTQPMYTNLQKDSPFREMMNFCMFKLAENGIIDHLRKYWDARKPICMESSKRVKVHVTLSEFSCGLLALFYGICFSLVFLIYENYSYHKNDLLKVWRGMKTKK